MQKMYLYNIADDYIQYLSQFDNKVRDAKIGNRSHDRKYIGVVLTVNGIRYFAPLSSPKPKDFNPDGSFRKDPLWLTRIVSINKDGKLECKGKINYSNMIPVPEQAVRRFSINDETDSAYRLLLIKEIDFVTKHRAEIYQKATTIYRQKMMEKEFKVAPRYLACVVDFGLLEEKCLAYKKLSTFKQNPGIQLKATARTQMLAEVADLVNVELAPMSVANERIY